MEKPKTLLTDEFNQFWACYPRKVAKLAAIKKYEQARRIATAEEILAGVERYKRNKRSYADYCLPTTFLAQGRWMDEETPEPTKPAAGGTRLPAWAAKAKGLV